MKIASAGFDAETNTELPWKSKGVICFWGSGDGHRVPQRYCLWRDTWIHATESERKRILLEVLWNFSALKLLMSYVQHTIFSALPENSPWRNLQSKMLLEWGYFTKPEWRIRFWLSTINRNCICRLEFKMWSAILKHNQL